LYIEVILAILIISGIIYLSFIKFTNIKRPSIKLSLAMKIKIKHGVWIALGGLIFFFFCNLDLGDISKNLEVL